MFKRNMGFLDRTIRIVVAAILLPVGLFLLGGTRGAALGLVVAGFSLLPLLTGLSGFCPLYLPFGFSSRGLEHRAMKSMMKRCMGKAGQAARSGVSGSGCRCGAH